MKISRKLINLESIVKVSQFRWKRIPAVESQGILGAPAQEPGNSTGGSKHSG